ncbi:MAG TPA: GNAT family N-acetyltransferase [Pyrinomonadaceae bacterium]|nr:GNAT family N-acetyltransferase [Pyrinomonadaceae bacterium]
MSIESLIIRRAEPDDAEALYEIFTASAVYAGTLQLLYPSREYWRERLAENIDSVYNLVGVIEGRIVGMVSVHTFPNKPRRRHAGAIGICVDEKWQGKGVGIELMRAIVDFADNWLNLTRLELEVYADNKAAIRLYERFEFEVEGTLRQHALRDGQFIDSIVMGRLRPGKEKQDESV